MKTYIALAADAASLDVTAPEAAGFRRRFNAYYGVRRNEAWRVRYYAAFEAAKEKPGSSRELFKAALGEMRLAQGRTEASFTSKLVATLRPEAPLIDSVVRGFFGLYVTLPPIDGPDSAFSFYLWLEEAMTRLSESREARTWFEVFNTTFDKVPGAGGIHPVKKLDFLIWAGAER